MIRSWVRKRSYYLFLAQMLVYGPTDYRDGCCHGEHLFGVLQNFSFYGEPTRSEDEIENLHNFKGSEAKTETPTMEMSF